MKKYKIKGLPTQQNAALKNRIVKTRMRAKWVGVVYLAACLFVLVSACFPLMKSDYVKIGLIDVWREFSLDSFQSMRQTENIIPFVVAVLYIGILAVLIGMFIRTLWSIRGLFKHKANRKYGFNRNVNAMQRIGKVFSNMFAVVVGGYFIIFMLSGSGKPTVFFFVFMVLCLVVHFLGGIRGGKASYFDVGENGQMQERRRRTSRVIPFIRNFVQIIGVFAMMTLFLRASHIHECIEAMLRKDVWVHHFWKNVVNFASLLLQFVTAFSLLTLLTHATGTAEFDIDGTQASGMKNYRVFAFFVFLSSGATFFYRKLFGEVSLRYIGKEGQTIVEICRWSDKISLILACIGLAMFVFEVLMRNYPHERIATNALFSEQTENSAEDGATDDNRAMQADVETVATQQEDDEVAQQSMDIPSTGDFA